MLSAGIGLLATIIVVPYAVRRIGKIRASTHPLLEALAVISLLVSMVIVGFAAGYYNMAIRTDQFPASTPSSTGCTSPSSRSAPWATATSRRPARAPGRW